MGTTRKEPRYTANAQVFITDTETQEALLKDLSSRGLCIKSESFLGIVPNSRYVIDIIPKEEDAFNQFELEVESRWIRTNKRRSESGFAIIVPGTSAFKKYVDYLCHRNEAQNKL